ncbi:MAG: response regulator transcription factor [Clostridiales bacterium]|nr:response regulator transcription factor [Clostridiales bacterium]
MTWDKGRGILQYPESSPTLTGRETQVLRRLVGGQTNKQIANELGITPKTVEFHVSKLLKKHAVSSRFELTDSLRR